MNWIVQLLTEPSVAMAVLVIAIVATFGLAAGSFKFFGINLGIACVLFAGIVFGHVQESFFPIASTAKREQFLEILDFAEKFGLILFVYTIGMQVGPGFLASLRRAGLPLNIMAASVVLMGVVVTLVIGLGVMGRANFPYAVGLLSGATTNTPSLAAAKQALKDLDDRKPAAAHATTQPATQPATQPVVAAADPHATSHGKRSNQPSVGYAIAYPFGVFGIILTMILIKRVFRVDTAAEAELLSKLGAAAPNLSHLNIVVRNSNLAGLRLDQIPMLKNSRIVVSRILRAQTPNLATDDTIIRLGDTLLAVGPKDDLADLLVVVGEEAPVDLKTLPSRIESRRILITHKPAVGKTIGELDLQERFGVNLTRVDRNGIEIAAADSTRLQYADRVVVVGTKETLDQVAKQLGDSPKALNHPQLIPIFLGIALGVLLGSLPISLPGLPVPFTLGLAAGPLLVAITLSRIGNIGPLVWYMPTSANFMLREVGITLFLAAVGVKVGPAFFGQLASHWEWVLYGGAITLIPILTVGLVARWWFKVNYITLCGVLAGSMTDPPALAFATQMSGSDGSQTAYAAVYPLTMLLRVLSAQVLVLAVLG